MTRKWMSMFITGSLMVSLISPAVYGSEAQQSDAVRPFHDLAAGHWAEAAAAKLNGFGLMSGYEDGAFKPSSPITRAEFVTILDRAFGFRGGEAETFADVPSDAWYYDAVIRASGSKIVSGIAEGRFQPNASITREDAAVMIDRAFELSDELNSEAALQAFQDYDSISGYSKKALTYLVKEKIMQGVNGQLLPKKQITRAEAAVILSGMIGDMVTEPGVYDVPKVDGNLIIRSNGVTVKNTVIDGNLLLGEGIMEGEATLEGVTVTERTIVKGGGSHSIVFKHAELGSVVVDKRRNPVRVAFQEGTVAQEVFLQQPAQFELSQDSIVGSLTVGPEADGSQVKSEGTIKSLHVEPDGVTINGEEVSAGLTTSLEPAGNEQGTTGITTPATPGASSGEKPAASTTIPDEQWQLVWNDEFNEPVIDTSKWTVMDTGVVYNNELEYYRPDNASIEKEGKRSVLSMTAKKEAHLGSDYTSAKLITREKGDWTYGKVVVRAKLPVQQGMWPAIWMLPTDEAHYGGWPASGEIDMMELIGGGQNKSRVYGTLHFDSVQPDGSHGHDQGTYTLPEGESIADGYHDFQMEWLPGVIRFYVDGQLYHEVNDWRTKGPGQPEYYTYPAPFDRPFYLILNLAVGGDWPGAPSGDFVSEAMKVDFVRVYEYKKMDSWPDVTGNPPEPTQKREPQADGNQLYNHDFKGTADTSGVPDEWQFITNANGAGSVAVVDDAAKGKAAKVSIVQAGDQSYSIQLTQMPMYVQKGKKYKVTFDAKADANRSIMSKVNQFQKNWTNYSGENNFALTTDWQSFAYTFDMRASTDNNARFEFNLGLDANAVYVANVKLVEIGDAAPLPEEPIERTALQDGNLIYNGTFDQGPVRLAFWHTSIATGVDAQVTVNNFLRFPIMERQLVVHTGNGGAEPEAVTVAQPELPLEANTTYGLYFEAKSETPRQIEVDFVSAGGHEIQFPKGATVQLGTNMQTFAKDITIGDGAALAESELKLLLGGASGTVYVDNVRLVKRGQPVHVAGYAHAAAAQAWEMQGLQLEDASEGGKNIGYMDEGDLLQYKISVERSEDYIISARMASAEDDSQVRLSIKDEAGATVAQSAYVLGNTDGWQTYKTVYFEPVRLESGKSYYVDFEGNDYNTLWVDFAENLVHNGGMDDGTSEWNLITASGASLSHSETGNLVVQLPGTTVNWWDDQLQQSSLNIVRGKTYRLELDASSSVPKTMQVVVSESSGDYTKYLDEETPLSETPSHMTYTFTMDEETDPSAVLALGLGMPASAGGAHSVTVDNIRLYEVNPAADQGGQPLHINLLHNGDFTKGTEGWLSYSAGDTMQLVMTAENGKLQAAIGTVGDNPWDRQVINEGFGIQKGSRYTLTFKAKADTARKLGLGIGWVDVAANYAWHGYYGQQVDLTTEEQTFTFTFDATEESYRNARISFDMGNIAGGNAGDTTITIFEVTLVNIGPASTEELQ